MEYLETNRTINQIPNLVEYELKEILPGIFSAIIKDDYQRAMLFLRCQEYYESAFSEIKGKNFEIFEFMEIYRKPKGNDIFMYPLDWGGFNVPGHIIETCINSVFRHSSGVYVTPYDYIMDSIVNRIKEGIKKNKRWYLIGVDKEDSKTMEHEICHGLYYTNRAYKKKTLEMVRAIPDKISKRMRDILSGMGYCKEVLNDEIQAYLSVEPTKEMSKIRGIKKLQKSFQNHLSEYL